MPDNMNDKPMIVCSHDVHLDAGYTSWIHDVKRRYRQAQVKASVKVNSEQLLFNWTLGRDLAVKKVEEVWGSGVVEQVSLDLQSEFPDAKGFSVRNLWNMKKWYLFYAADADSSQKLLSLESAFELGSEKLQQIAAEIHQGAEDEKLPQAVAGKHQSPARACQGLA